MLLVLQEVLVVEEMVEEVMGNHQLLQLMVKQTKAVAEVEEQLIVVAMVHLVVLE
jgi:hypothetical protein